MRNGVVIGCVGVVAAAAAIGVCMRPAASSAVAVSLPATPMVTSRNAPRVGVKAASRAARPEGAAASSPAGSLPAAYRILLTRSIFCPSASLRVTRSNSPESTLALRGIVQERRGFVAFVENTVSGEACTVNVGDTVGRGKVINIDLHSVEFVEGKRAMRVAVGQTFEGASSTASADSTALAAVHPQLD